MAAGLRGSPPRAGTWAAGTPRGPGWERLSTDTCSPALPTDRGLPRGFSVPAHDSPRLARRERCSQSVGHPSLQKEPRVGPVQEPPVTSHHPGWGRGGEPGEGALLSPQLLRPGLVTAPSEGVSWAVGLAPPLPSPLS